MIRFDGRSEVCTEKDNIAYEISIINNCVLFCKGAVFQGKRLLESLNARDDNFRELLQLEEEFFVFALDRAIFHIKMINSKSEFNNIIQQVNENIGLENVKDVRDMRTHIDNYKNKKGREQKRFFASPDIDSPIFRNKPNIDATSSIMIDKHYMIGGRIDFYKALELLEKILPDIEKLCQSRRFELVKLQRKKKQEDSPNE